LFYKKELEMSNLFFNQLQEAHERGTFSTFIQKMADSGELFTIFPELKNLNQVPQNPIFHPEGDVWTHTLLVVENLPPNATFAMALSALFHDIGKATKTVIHEDGRITAHGHENASKRIASGMLDALGASENLKREVLFLVGRHMLAHSKDTKLKTLQKLVNEAGSELVDQLLLHGVADVKSGSKDFTECIRLRELFNTIGK